MAIDFLKDNSKKNIGNDGLAKKQAASVALAKYKSQMGMVVLPIRYALRNFTLVRLSAPKLAGVLFVTVEGTICFELMSVV